MGDLGFVSAGLADSAETHAITVNLTSIEGGDGPDVLDFGNFQAVNQSSGDQYIDPAGSSGSYVLADRTTGATWTLAYRNIEGLIGSPYGDHLVATTYLVSLSGGAGEDTLDHSMVAESLHYLRGGEGADVIIGGQVWDHLSGDEGNDTLNASWGDDTLLGGLGADSMMGDRGADVLNGNSGADTITGGWGADTLRGGQDADQLNGDLGDDQIYGDLGDDTLQGDDGDDLLSGNQGADSLYGAAGADTLRGGQGADLLAGEAGDDQIFGDLGDDTLTGGQGADVFHVAIGAGADVITDFKLSEHDRVQIDGDGEFKAEQAGADVRITMTSGRPGDPSVTVATLRNVDLGTLTEDWIGKPATPPAPPSADDPGALPHPFGSAEVHLVASLMTSIDGGDGLDVLDFGAFQGVSVSRSGGGTYVMGDRATGASWSLDYVNFEGLVGSPYDDLMIASHQTATLSGGDGADTLDGNSIGSWIGHYLYGGDGRDGLTGGNYQDYMTGDQGSDALNGGPGDDTLLGGQGDDALFGGEGADLLNGNSGADTLDGYWGADTLRGGQGADALAAGDGDDQLFGDLGDDTLTGGQGADVFHVAIGGGADVITDFKFGEHDHVQVDGDVNFRAEQAGADVRVSLIYGNVGAPVLTEVVLQNVNLAALPEGWISH